MKYSPGFLKKKIVLLYGTRDCVQKRENEDVSANIGSHDLAHIWFRHPVFSTFSHRLSQEIGKCYCTGACFFLSKISGDSCWLVVIGFLIAFVSSTAKQQLVLLGYPYSWTSIFIL
jgi:hypothetical protein